MSQENVEVVRRHIDAFRQDDVPQALSQLDPYVVLDWSRGRRLGLTVAYGHEEVTQTVRHWIGAFEDYDYGVERLTDLGSGAVSSSWPRKDEERAAAFPSGSPSPCCIP